MESEPRVVMLESGGWGGLAHYTYNLCQALGDAGIDVTLQTRSPFELADLPRSFALREVAATATYGEMTAAVLATVRETGTGILHMQSTISARRDLLWLTRLRWGGCRLVTTAHNVLPHDESERNALGMRWALRRIYRMSDRIIAHGDDTRRQIVDLFGIEEAKVAVIPLGNYQFATPDHDADEAKAWMGLKPESRLILAFGAIRVYKGVPDLVDAFAEIADQFPDTHLAIVGKPIRVEPDDYRRQIEELGLTSRVTFRPEYVPFADIGRYFAACDIAAYPYRAINQSAALQLAYGSARPVVATAVGELSSTVRDGWNGLLVPPADPSALAAALRHLLSLDAAELRAMGQRSLEIAEQEHGWDEVAETTAQLYRALQAPNKDSAR